MNEPDDRFVDTDLDDFVLDEEVDETDRWPEEPVAAGFNPDQSRDDAGRFGTGGMAADKATGGGGGGKKLRASGLIVMVKSGTARKMEAINDGTQDKDVVRVPMSISKEELGRVEQGFPGKRIEVVNATKLISAKDAEAYAKSALLSGNDRVYNEMQLKTSEYKAHFKEWEGSLTTPEKAAMKEWFKASFAVSDSPELRKAFNSALDKAPPVKGTVYRGMTVKGAALKSLTSVGGEVSFKSNQSCSLSKTVAEYFADSQGTGAHEDLGLTPVLMRIKSKSGGAYIAPLGGKSYKNQKEVVLRQKTSYTVRGVSKTKVGYEVDLEEK